MNIKFINIELNNFLSFSHIIFDLNQSGFISIKGRNSNIIDSSLSNGSGKSALFDGIFWALTGQTIRGTKDVANIFINNGVNVKLLFEIDSNKYYIIRSKDDPTYRTNLKIFKNDLDISGKGIRDSEKILETELPDLSTQLLGSVILLGQGLPQRFSNNTPSGRKEILEKLSKSDYMIEDLKMKFSQRKTYINQEQRRIEDELLTYNTINKSLHSDLDQLEKNEQSLIQISEEEYNQRKIDIENQLKDVQILLRNQ